MTQTMLFNTTKNSLMSFLRSLALLPWATTKTPTRKFQMNLKKGISKWVSLNSVSHFRTGQPTYQSGSIQWPKIKKAVTARLPTPPISWNSWWVTSKGTTKAKSKCSRKSGGDGAKKLRISTLETHKNQPIPTLTRPQIWTRQWAIWIIILWT